MKSIKSEASGIHAGSRLSGRKESTWFTSIDAKMSLVQTTDRANSKIYGSVAFEKKVARLQEIVKLAELFLI